MDRYGDTPLHAANHHAEECTEIIPMLLDAGANPSALNNKGVQAMPKPTSPSKPVPFPTAVEPEPVGKASSPLATGHQALIEELQSHLSLSRRAETASKESKVSTEIKLATAIQEVKSLRRETEDLSEALVEAKLQARAPPQADSTGELVQALQEELQQKSMVITGLKKQLEVQKQQLDAAREDAARGQADLAQSVQEMRRLAEREEDTRLVLQKAQQEMAERDDHDRGASAERRAAARGASSVSPSPPVSRRASAPKEEEKPPLDRSQEREWAKRQVAAKRAQEEEEEKNLSPRGEAGSKASKSRRSQAEMEADQARRLEKVMPQGGAAGANSSTPGKGSPVPRSPATPLATSGKGAIGSPVPEEMSEADKKKLAAERAADRAAMKKKVADKKAAAAAEDKAYKPRGSPRK